MERGKTFDKIWEAYEAGEVIPVCAWCNLVRIGEDWLEPEPWALSTIDERMTLSHSICPRCAESQLAPNVSEALTQ